MKGIIEISDRNNKQIKKKEEEFRVCYLRGNEARRSAHMVFAKKKVEEEMKWKCLNPS